MGAWGPDVFENDTACDFAMGVAEGGGVTALAEAIERVLAVEGRYLEAQMPRKASQLPRSLQDEGETWPTGRVYGRDRRVDQRFAGPSIR